MKKCDEKKMFGTAKFTRYGNDLYWDFTDLRFLYGSRGECIGSEFFHARWSGYDDANWWDNVAPNIKPIKCTSDKGTVAYFRIDFRTCKVEEVDCAERSGDEPRQ